MICPLYISSVSACFELQNDRPYYTQAPYRVCLNGEEVLQKDSNVFSLFKLTPATEYTLTLEYQSDVLPVETLTFTTSEALTTVSVKAFGAVGDGVHDDTQAIQTAIHFLPKNGCLYLPAGTYLTAPIALKSHMTLHLEEGAVLLGTTDRSRYPVIPGTAEDLSGGEDVQLATFEGNAVPMYQALVMAAYAEDITIIGPGCIDGNAQNSDFWQVYRTLPIARPRLLFFNRCQNITVHGIKACNSASWQLHPYYSDHLSFLDVFVQAPSNSPNTDALDPEACDDVRIIGCRFSVGDDCIAVKSSKIELGSHFKKAASNHVIRNCLMDFGHGGVTLGSEIGAGVRNLHVTKCYFHGTDRGLRIKTRRGRGKDCTIDGVVFDNIRMDGVLSPIVINMWYNRCDPDGESEYVWSREHLPVDDRTPHLGFFSFQNLECTGAEVAACYIDALPEAPIDEVEFKNVSVRFSENAHPGIPAMMNFEKEYCRLGLYLDNVRKIRLDNVTLEGVEGEELVIAHCDDLDIRR